MFNTSLNKEVNWLQILIGISALVIGVVLYLLDRPSGQTYFVPESISLFEETSKLFGMAGEHLPTFLHVFGFCLITCGILTQNRWVALGVCSFWVLLDGLFEIGQHPAIASLIVEHIPGWFNNVPILENTQAYFLSGRFDPMDLLSVLLGGILAYVVVIITPKTQKI
ncbi:MAG: hypothetical protein ABFS45_17640 [Pseudomonadota bacterium]